MSWHKRIDSLKELDLTNFEGYIWASDQKNPQITTDLSDFINSQNPFILEGNFYKDTVSISIKHVAGRYIITQYNLADLKKENLVNKSYLVHAELGTTIHFQEIWITEKDENCADMEVLTKKAVAFVGFEKEVK